MAKGQQRSNKEKKKPKQNKAKKPALAGGSTQTANVFRNADDKKGRPSGK